MTTQTHPDRPLLGISLMLGFCILAPMGDALAKLLGESVPTGQIVTFRFLVQAIALIPVVWLMRLSLKLELWQLRLIFIRTLLHIAGITAMFQSLLYLPLADAVAIAFVMPFIMLLLGKTVLGEEVGPRRLAASAVGFIGTLLVVQPSFAAVGAPALLPLVVAVVFALFMLVTRQLAKDTDPVALQFVSGGMACAMLLPLTAVASAFGWTALAPVDPGAWGWGLLIAVGLLGTGAHLLMTWSLRYAPSATLAPMQYLEIPVATLVGLLLFGDFPNGLALLGILITMAAGLYIIARERTITRKVA